MVQIILTGATGFVGDIALRFYLTRSEINSIVVLSRRDLSDELKNHPKVTVIIHDDFSSYPESLLEQLQNAVACIWTLGLRGAPLGYKDPSYAETVDVTYPLAAATALSKHLTNRSSLNTFRFVLLSGWGAELDQTKSFWMLHDTRLLKGRIEQKLHALAEEKPMLDVYTCRPFGIMEQKPPLAKTLVFSLIPSVKALELVAAMLELALKGNGHGKWIFENDEIAAMGKQILQNQKNLIDGSNSSR